MELKKVKIAAVIIPEVRARAKLTEEQKEFLHASKEKYGTLTFPVVRPAPQGKYELIDGENRLLEDEKKGLKECEVLVTKMDDKDASMANLLLNVARGTQDPIGAAQSLKKALDSGADIEDMAKVTGHTAQWVKKTVALLDLPERYQDALEQGELKVGHVDEVMRLTTPEEMDAALQTTMKLKWSAGVLKNYVDNRLYDLKVASEHGDNDILSAPPLPDQRESMARYRQCMICSRMVDASQIRLPTMCEDCYRLARYCVDQAGEPTKAMDEIFKALDFMRSYQRFEGVRNTSASVTPPLKGTEQPPE